MGRDMGGWDGGLGEDGGVMTREVIDVTLRMHHETEKAFLVSDDGDKDKAVWIPKSQCERGDAKGAGIYEFTLPEWLALDKGLI